MLVTLIATFGVSAILVGVMAALSMIERHLAPGGRRAPQAADSSWPLGPTARHRAGTPFADRRLGGCGRSLPVAPPIRS
jgi:hypothetical protein